MYTVAYTRSPHLLHFKIERVSVQKLYVLSAKRTRIDPEVVGPWFEMRSAGALPAA